MNERDMARKIVSQLNRNLVTIDRSTQQRLASSREKALEAYRHPQHALQLAWAGSFSGGMRHFRAHPGRWLSASLLMALILAFALYWQSSRTSDIGDIDASLLGGDLPIQAYLDKNFDTWLAEYSQQ